MTDVHHSCNLSMYHMAGRYSMPHNAHAGIIAYIYAYTCVCACVCMCMYVCVCVCVCVIAYLVLNPARCTCIIPGLWLIYARTVHRIMPVQITEHCKKYNFLIHSSIRKLTYMGARAHKNTLTNTHTHTVTHIPTNLHNSIIEFLSNVKRSDPRFHQVIKQNDRYY